MPAGAKAAGSQRTTGTPRPRTFDMSRQVSWLAGHCLGQTFPDSRPVALHDVGSPLTVAGAAPALSRSHDQPAPASLLAPEDRILRRTSTSSTMGALPQCVKLNIKTSLCRYILRRQTSSIANELAPYSGESVRTSQFICDHTGLGQTRVTRRGLCSAMEIVDYALGVARLP